MSSTLIWASSSDNSSAEDEIPRIVGGYRLGQHQYPYVAGYSSQQGDQLIFLCGASIISKTFVLTAAHCVDVKTNGLGVVRVGSLTKNQGGEVVKVKAAFVHELFKTQVDHDFALLQLEQPLKLSKTVKKVHLPEKNFEIPEGESVFVAGWGRLAEHGALSNQLMGIHLKVFNTKKCVEIYSNMEEQASKNNICTYVGQGKDACDGDSGGGLIHKSVIVGVVSFGEGCAREGVPGVYSKVSMVVDWIKEVMEKFS